MKCLISVFIFLKLLLLNLHYSEGTIEVKKTVKDKVVLPCNFNISSEELARVRIYWQKGDAVVMTLMAGKEKWWPEYENRTFFLANNLSIVILALRPSDNGTYTCVVQKQDKTSFKLVHLNLVMLFVRADFSVPNITDLGSPSPMIRRISCSTSGGFPEPHLSWLENGEELKATNKTLSQDPDTELYTIRSELEFNVTTNHSFVCLVKYGNLTVSKNFNWQKNESDRLRSSVKWVYALTMCPVLIILYVLYRSYRTQREREIEREWKQAPPPAEDI
ncbi:PREDICTED: T-lymphocyte activation antigen CD80 [Condylura cristata]|uniref:T-lymphocyte activation antigen CD80 n=1 Tax=Condylura cristata TaxID=143302 RepID=UPI0006438FE5|nr:PREDICTED: T-lymphocyte activation antigen CD80 [Condylura cristata]